MGSLKTLFGGLIAVIIVFGLLLYFFPGSVHKAREAPKTPGIITKKEDRPVILPDMSPALPKKANGGVTAKPPPVVRSKNGAPKSAKKSVSERLDEIDEILKSLEPGNIAFNVPQKMNLQETAMIQLVLGVDKTIEELKSRIKAPGPIIDDPIRVSDQMEARLTGTNFAITAITPERQPVSRSETTEWKWEVKPKSAGSQFLHLTLSAVLTVEGSSVSKTIQVYDRKIQVEVSWGQKVQSFVEKNWQWLWATLLVPLAGWLWNKWRKKKKPKAQQ